MVSEFGVVALAKTDVILRQPIRPKLRREEGGMKSSARHVVLAAVMTIVLARFRRGISGAG
mgnify:CR=1 FL=1